MSRWKHGESPFGESIGAKFDLGDKGHLYGRITLSNQKGSYASTTKIFDSITTIFDDRRFDFPLRSSLHGVSEKGRVSLISCHRGSARFDSTTMSCTVRSHYAVFGNDYLRRHDPVIREVQFGFEDLHTVFDHHGRGDAFGVIVDPDDRIVEAIDKYKPDYVPSIGEYKHPWVSYFSGKYDLLPATRTVLGLVSAQRYLSSSTSSGISISAIPYITIDFGDEPVTFDDAVDKMKTVRRFFAWIIGYAPKFANVRIFTGDKPREGEYDPGFDVFMSISSGTTGREKLGGSILVSASQPKYFMGVMENWLKRNSERLQANLTFFSLMRGMFTTVIENKMCAAANVFDQLPVCDKPGRAQMLDVALHRYQKVIRPHLKLPRMKEVIRSGINCRVYFTHGGLDPNRKTYDVDYSNYRSVVFLTEALRFVYGASELIECGWDMTAWKDLPLTHEHLFGAFIKAYEGELAAAMG